MGHDSVGISFEIIHRRVPMRYVHRSLLFGGLHLPQRVRFRLAYHARLSSAVAGVDASRPLMNDELHAALDDGVVKMPNSRTH